MISSGQHGLVCNVYCAQYPDLAIWPCRRRAQGSRDIVGAMLETFTHLDVIIVRRLVRIQKIR